MANPQTEDGFLKIANEIIDALARLHLSGNQWRVLMVVLRQTYGWNQKEARITVTQFQQKTGLDRRHTVRELNALISRKIIAKIGNGKNITYRFQKDFSQWQSLPKMAPIAKNGNVAIAKNGNDQKILPSSKDILKTQGDFLSEIHFLIERYPDPEIIEKTFQEISSTRKTGRIADSVKLGILKSWAKYPVESVMQGIRTYLEKNYASEGKNEKYLAGIIRNLPTPPATPTGPTMRRSGSYTLDRYYESEGYTLI